MRNAHIDKEYLSVAIEHMWAWLIWTTDEGNMTRTLWKVFLGMMQVLATEGKPCRFRLMQMWTRHTSGRCTARTRSEYSHSVWLLHVCLVLVSFDIAITIARCRDHKACRGVMQCIGIAGNQQAVNCWPASTEKSSYLLVRFNHMKVLSRSILESGFKILLIIYICVFMHLLLLLLLLLLFLLLLWILLLLLLLVLSLWFSFQYHH